MLDIRWPIGLMFAFLGLLLVVVGASSSPETYHRALDININLIWGVVLLVFGALMLGLAARARKTPPAP